MSKVQLILLIAMSMVFSFLIICGTAFTALADDTLIEQEQTEQTDENAPESGEPDYTEPKDDSTDENPDGEQPTDEPNGLSVTVEKFTEFLKAKYGDDYEFYYNQIIEHWGSIEAYLLQFGTTLPEEYQNGWEAFVAWLGKYSVMWAPALAIAIIIIVALLGKKKFNDIIEKIVNSKLSPIVQELNTQSNATVSIIRAQKALLGNNAKFAESVKDLDKSEKELTTNG